MRWVLPDYIQDILPTEAAQIEDLRRAILQTFRLHGYQLVTPPLLEYLDSLLTGAGRDLGLRTFQLVDQLSGRAMGVRADMTPQVARIDAHLLNRQGVSRLCYCASVLHTLPSSLSVTREPLQLGAEVYGHAGIEADIEILCLLAAVMTEAGVSACRIDISHIGIFHALVKQANLPLEAREELFNLLQAKDIPGLQSLLAGAPEVARKALVALPDLYGDVSVLQAAERILPRDVEIESALAQMRMLARTLPDLPLSFDLADLRGYHYHSGIVFAAYGARSSGALALGGRYDAVGQSFGRARPATGFSLDLRHLVACLPARELPGAILASWSAEAAGLSEVVEGLRAKGEVVVAALPGHEGSWREAGCDRCLVQVSGNWHVVPLTE